MQSHARNQGSLRPSPGFAIRNRARNFVPGQSRAPKIEDDWAQGEFGLAELPDKRINKRLTILTVVPLPERVLDQPVRAADPSPVEHVFPGIHTQ